MLINILGHAAQAIATHFRFRAIRIEYAHACICLLRGHNQDQAVRANARMAITYDLGQTQGICYVFLLAVNIYVVIAKSMHLRKIHVVAP